MGRALRMQGRAPSALALRPGRPPFEGVRGALRSALQHLQPEAGRIERRWQRLLRRLDPEGVNREGLSGMDLASCVRPLAGRCGEPEYRLAIQRAARALLGSGVPEQDALGAVALYVEACLPHLQGGAEVRAVVRLGSVTQSLLAGAYGDWRTASLDRLDDRERQKLAGDLHDEVGSDLIVLKLYVEMIVGELAKGSPAPVLPKLREALALIAHAIDSVRRLTLDLGPAFLESLGFLPALRSLVRQYSLRTGIRVDLHSRGRAVAMPAGHETVLYRVLRGALSNVAKHSRARHVKVTLHGARDLFVMAVEDDGKGFDVSARGPDRSFGLSAMRERVRGIDGRLSIESWRAARRGQKSGTRVEVALPLGKGAA